MVGGLCRGGDVLLRCRVGESAMEGRVRKPAPPPPDSHSVWGVGGSGRQEGDGGGRSPAAREAERSGSASTRTGVPPAPAGGTTPSKTKGHRMSEQEVKELLKAHLPAKERPIIRCGVQKSGDAAIMVRKGISLPV